MAKTVKQKGARPPTRRHPASAVRLPAELTAAIDRWAAREKVASRSEAIRHLVEFALTSWQQRGRRDAQSASRASEMAAKRIDELADPTVPEEEQRARKRRLIKGPREFRELRADQEKKPKA